jgi:hypothetical protein
MDMEQKGQWAGIERRASSFTEAEIDFIAEKAAEKALEKVYTSIGRSVVSKVLYFIGAAALAVAAFLKGTGKF